MKLRVGLVGVSDDWESRHQPALRTLSNRFVVRAVCDEVALKAQQLARQFDAVAVDGFQTLATRSDVDALMLLAPQWYGCLPILAGCDAGKAIYCAMAPDIVPAEATRLKQRLEESGIAFMAEFPRRVAPATLRLKELIATRLGPPRLLFCHHRNLAKSRKEPTNHRQPRQPAQNRELLELIDWCQYIVGGRATTTNAFRHRAADTSRSDYQVLSLDFSPPGAPGTGTLAQISSGEYIPPMWHEAISFRPPAALQVCCENGIAFVDMPSTLIWFDQAGRHMESLDSERPVSEQLLRQFHRGVTSLVRNTVSLEDAFAALQVLATAQTSWEQQRRVEVG